MANAYRFGETSPDPGGLPARFILKAAIPGGFILIFLQGLSLAGNSLLRIVGPGEQDEAAND